MTPWVTPLGLTWPLLLHCVYLLCIMRTLLDTGKQFSRRIQYDSVNVGIYPAFLPLHGTTHVQYHFYNINVISNKECCDRILYRNIFLLYRIYRLEYIENYIG